MFKAKEVSLQNIAVYVTLSLVAAAGIYLARPHQAAVRSAPIFMGKEVTARQAAKPATVTVPAPQPPAVPLPIIPPSITYSVLPAYPSAALAKGAEGVVLLSVYVGLTGQPERLETKASSGNQELDAAALKAAGQWRFQPATQGGAALASWFEVPVRFVIR
ncbi:MAG: energy transducer TonB [Candidatus Saganbacteria bacterium]|nr:energy transducer TonB [Candidatus Saganbacteria bacterium]